MNKLFKFAVLMYLLVVGQVLAKNNADTAKLERIKENITKTMVEFQVPGVAVAIVKDGEVLLNQGFGITKKGTSTKVNEHTLFGIASNTKAMTAALLAQLVDQGKITWQTKVNDIIPEFQMPDAYVTSQFTITDLLAHNSGLGLGAGDLMIWPQTDHTVDNIIRGIRHLPQVSSFRSEFAYDNLMYIVAGEVIARVTGKSWQQNIKDNIFTPLGMNETKATFSSIEKGNKNVARAHVPMNGELSVVGGNFLEQFASAGSVASNVNDMSKWLRAILNKGIYDQSGDKRLYSAKQSHLMWQAKTNLPVSERATKEHKTNFYAYGLGWFLNDYHGVKMVSHSGGILGMVSKVVLIPEENLGMVILTNQQSGLAFNTIYRNILQEFLTTPNKDWLAYYKDLADKSAARENEKQQARTAARATNSVPSLALIEYANTYTDNWYGDIKISLIDDKLKMQFMHTKELVGELEHYQHNTFIVRWQDRTLEADAYVNFNLNADGSINNVKMKAVSDKTDFSFDFHDLTLKIK